MIPLEHRRPPYKPRIQRQCVWPQSPLAREKIQHRREDHEAGPNPTKATRVEAAQQSWAWQEEAHTRRQSMGTRTWTLLCRHGHTRARALRDGQEASWGSGGPSWNRWGGIGLWKTKVPAPAAGRPLVKEMEEEGQQRLGQETEERVMSMAK